MKSKMEAFERALALAEEMRDGLRELNHGEEGGGWIHALTVPFGEFRIGYSLGVDDDEGVTLALFPGDLKDGEWPEWEIALAYYPFPKMDVDEMTDEIAELMEMEVEKRESEDEGRRDWIAYPR